jgi:hypothetical protein
VTTTTKAYHHTDEGLTWLRIVPESGMEWDEPISGWSEVHDLIRGRHYYRHTDGREYAAMRFPC